MHRFTISKISAATRAAKQRLKRQLQQQQEKLQMDLWAKPNKLSKTKLTMSKTGFNK